MIAVVWVQAILNALGSALAWIYHLVPNYGIAIVVFTLAIRLLLLPLGIRQIRSMHAMQQIQPKIRELQRRYKGDRQKMNEQMMALYKEHGYNPLSGCLPLILQFPVLIALFAVLSVPKGLTHIPTTSTLHQAIVSQEQGVHFLGTNLVCTAVEAGRGAVVTAKPGQENYGMAKKQCGSGIPTRIPYYVLALLMVGTTYYQQRQMQRANPSTDPQQQMLTRIMPLMFGIWGFIFPAGLVLYWTVTNVVQIGQQHFMLPKPGEAPPPATPAKPAGRPSPGAAGGGKRQQTPKRPAAGPRRPSARGPRSSETKGPRGAGDRKKRP